MAVHPNPLPRGEGESFAVAGEFAGAQIIVHPEAKPEIVATPRETSELHETGDGCSRSPGERVRVHYS